METHANSHDIIMFTDRTTSQIYFEEFFIVGNFLISLAM